MAITSVVVDFVCKRSSKEAQMDVEKKFTKLWQKFYNLLWQRGSNHVGIDFVLYRRSARSTSTIWEYVHLKSFFFLLC